MYDPKQHMIEIAKLVYGRHLSDTAGGNISLRHEGLIYVSPRFMGAQYHYNITREQISVLNAEHNVLEGPTDLSRESKMHLAAYDNFPEVNSVIHAHPTYLMVYAAASRTMKPVLEYTEKFGDIECIPESPAHSPDLAQHVVEMGQRRREQLKRVAMGVILPKHGVAVLGHDLNNAFDTLDRLEKNAQVSLLLGSLPEETA